MKKLIIIFILLFPIFVFGVEYHDSNINLTIDVDNHMVFTRNNLKDNPNLEVLEATEEQMKNIMDQGSIYFDIIPKDLSYEILVIVPEEKILVNNLSNVPTSFINELGDELAKRVGIDKSEVYKNKYVYVVRDYYDSKSGYNIINYYTVVNAKGYNFQLQKGERITEEERNTFKKIIDSINIEILDEYKDEREEVKKAIESDGKNGLDWQNILIKGLIGGAVGGLIGLFGFINKKRKLSKVK